MNNQLQQAIRRIRQMEQCFDDLQAALQRQEPLPASLLAQLIGYYESGQWLRDYELDEQGLLPPELKRGVLSQDGIYNFLQNLN